MFCQVLLAIGDVIGDVKILKKQALFCQVLLAIGDVIGDIIILKKQALFCQVLLAIGDVIGDVIILFLCIAMPGQNHLRALPVPMVTAVEWMLVVERLVRPWSAAVWP